MKKRRICCQRFGIDCLKKFFRLKGNDIEGSLEFQE